MLNQKQYETPDNFEARVNLTRKFKTNPEPWNRWIFKCFPVRENLKVLELGCGMGLFWRVNSRTVPKSWQITLTDYSQGMLETAKRNLAGLDLQFHFEITSAEDLKYVDESFDIIIANLMLYHIQDRFKALSGIARVLKNGGVFIASTFGQKNMIELNRLFEGYLKQIGKIRPERENSFSLENGYDQLAPFFSKIQLLRYEDHLEISETEPVIDYFLSFNNMKDNAVLLADEDVGGFRNILQTELEKNSIIKVSKDTGLFLCQK